MSTVEEIEAAIPKLTPSELKQLRAWIENYVQRCGPSAGEQGARRRSIYHLRTFPGKWTGERVLRSGDLAEEMFNGR